MQQSGAQVNENLIQWHAQLMDVDRVPILLSAILVTIVIGMISGPLAGNANPFSHGLISKIFGGIGTKLDRKNRPRADLAFRGFLLSAMAIFLAMLAGKALTPFPQSETYNPYRVAEILLLSLFLTSGTIWFVLLRLYFAIEQKQVGKGAFFAIARTTRTDLNESDEFGLNRTAMGFSARSFDKGLVSPAFWFLVGGFPLLFIYSTLTALSWRFGKDGFGAGFASVPLALERLMGFVPSMFSALILTLAASFTPTAKLHKSLASWIGYKDRAPYEQGGAPLSALAWALNISLGGPSKDLDGSAIKGLWVGPKGATAQIDHKHLRRGLYINVIAHILFIATLLGTYMWGSIL